MDLINQSLNLMAPMFSFFCFCFLVPPIYFYKCFLSVLSFFTSENVAGKVVLITGASSGIGEHLAYEYGSRGAFLAIVARREKQLEEVAETAREIGSPGVITIRGDVSKVEDCKRMVDETVNYFGRLDHLVNNAGVTQVCCLEEADDITDFRTVMDTNFWGSVYSTRFAVEHLRANNGKIVVLSSSGAWLPTPRMSIYNASKAALLSVFETLRTEFGSDIPITIATPGFVESEMTQGKFVRKEGETVFDPELRDVQLGALPVASVRNCAKAIVNGACRGDKYVTVPGWFKMSYYWKVFCPDVLDWTLRFLYCTRPGEPAYQAPSKKILDFTGAKHIFYPDTLHNTQIKSE
ncbi:11-beta-hydroxysteroid dehydrogenase 1A-like [Rutidosis leptorrhynchoides]|uniref:11-beta-hydroxysteroid dehydrogenase 1A-like n=1 Tax=Rutidosis leptorrhynchoides TaxID=125765 RepID=UPI003A9978FF